MWKRCFIGTVALTGATVAAAADAQQQGGATKGGDLEEVVVTASRREVKLLDVPLSIQAFSGDALESAGIKDVAQAVSFVPGASGTHSRSSGAIYQIRGISGVTGEATVGFYLDELAYTIPGLQTGPDMGLFDLERVEVLRGPQGTLYGQGSMGGTIRLITADPDLEDVRYKMATSYSATSGGDPNWDLNAAVSVPIVEDRFAVRASGTYRVLGGYAENIAGGPDPADGSTTQNYRLKALWTPSERATVTFTAQRYDYEGDSLNRFVSVDPPRQNMPEPTYDNSDYNAYSAFVRYEFDGVTLESGTGYLDQLTDLTLTSVTELGDAYTTAQLDTKGITQEIRLLSNNDSRFEWIAGGFYRDSKTDVDQDTIISSPGIHFSSLGGGSVQTESWALFGEVSMKFLDGKLVPLLGLRYAEDRRKTIGDSTVIFNDVVLLDSKEVIADTFDTLNPRFNLSYFPNERSLFYFNVAKGFRSGLGNSLADIFIFSLTDPDLPIPVYVDPDMVWSYEIGTRLQYLEGRVVVDGALYYNDWEDFQLSITSSAGGASATVNAGNAVAKGIDVGVSWEPIDSLVLRLAGNYNDSTFTSLGVYGENTIRKVGDRIDDVPTWNYALSGSYSWPVADWGEAFVYGSLAEVSERENRRAGALEMGAQVTQVSLRTGLRHGDWSFELYGDNLTNDLGPESRNAGVASLMYPRTYGLAIRLSH